MSAGSKSCDGLDEATCAVMETSMLEEEGYFNPPTSSGAGVSETGGKKQLESLCRVCANTSDYFIPIFEGEGVEHQLDMKIQKHLPIQVLETDGLPAQVCYQCASTLIAWHDLVTACVEADKKLHQLLQEEEDEEYEDREEKVIEFFNEPPVDSDGGDEFNEPSTSAAVVKVKQSSPPQKRRTTGKGKQQQRKAQVENASSVSDAKNNTVPVVSKEACASLKGVVESASSTERWPASPISSHVSTQEGNKSDCPTVREKTLSCTLACGLKHAVMSPWCNTATKITESVKLHTQSYQNRPAVVVESEINFLRKACTEVTAAEQCVLKNEEDVECGVKRECRELISALASPGVKVSAPEKNWHKQKLGLFISKRMTSDHLVEAYDVDSCRVVVDGRTLYHCFECGKHLGRSSFINHLRIHTGEKPFTCHICGKQFRVSSLLNRHVRDVHEGIKNHPCEYCGRKFASKKSRNEHRITHTGERTCVCHLCGKSFKTKASLFVHNIFHSDKFPHECLQCSRRFRRRQQLNEHVRLHTGEKPYLCTTCGKTFRLQHELKRHTSIHTNEKVFSCSVCKQTFSQKRYLKSHMRVHEIKLCFEEDSV